MKSSEDKREFYEFENPARLVKMLVKLKAMDPESYAVFIQGIIFGKDLPPGAEVLPGSAEQAILDEAARREALS